MTERYCDMEVVTKALMASPRYCNWESRQGCEVRETAERLRGLVQSPSHWTSAYTAMSVFSQRYRRYD